MFPPVSLIVYSAEPDAYRELREALATHPQAQLLAGCDSAEQIYAEIARHNPAAAIVVVLGESADYGLSLIKRLAASYPTMAFIAAARNSTPDLVMRSIRAGAGEFLSLPAAAEELRTVLGRVAEFCAEKQAAAQERGRVVAVFSSKGGCGASFLAANLAAVAEAPTLLVDLNLQAGDLALFLDMEQRYSILNLVEQRARLDDTLLGTFIKPHPKIPRLSFLAAPRGAEQAEAAAASMALVRAGEGDGRVDADRVLARPVVEVIQRFLRPRYERIVVDLPHTFDEITLDVLSEADDILLVINSGIPAIRSARQSLELFDRLGYPRSKIRLVANRWNRKLDLDLQREVELAHGDNIIGYIPSDYRRVMESINVGQPLVRLDPGSKAAEEIRRIASQLLGAEQHAAPSRRGLFSLFGASVPEPERAAR